MKECGAYIEHRFGKEVEDLLRQRSAGWLSFAIQTTIPWPQDDVAIKYDECWYILKGVEATSSHGPCLILQCHSKEDRKQKVQKAYLFVSMLGWFKGGTVDVESYISGTHPILYGGRPILD